MSRKTEKKKKSLSSIFWLFRVSAHYDTLSHKLSSLSPFIVLKSFSSRWLENTNRRGFKWHSKLARWLSFQGIKVTTAVWMHERGANSAKRNQPDSRRDSSNHDWTNVQVQQNLISNLLHAKNWSLHYPEYNSTAYSSGIWLCFCAFMFGSVGWKGKFAKMRRKAGEHFCL